MSCFEMELKRDLVVGLTALSLIALIGTASYFAFLKDQKSHQRLTQQTTANITNVSARREVDPTSGAQHVVNISVTYKYVIGPEEYERNITLGNSASSIYRTGELATVCYNPENHAEAELFPPSHKCEE